jgi:lysozyme
MMNLREMIRLHEGSRILPYEDSKGILTIGVGHNIEANGLPLDILPYVIRHGGITIEMENNLLEQDLQIAEEELLHQHPWVEELNYARRAVLIDMSFNMGLPVLNKFVKTLQYAKEGKWEDCSKEMLDSTWARQVGPRATRLSRIMYTGEMPS